MQIEQGVNEGASLMDNRGGKLPDARPESRGANELSDGVNPAANTAEEADDDPSRRRAPSEQAAEGTLEVKVQSVTVDEPCEIDLTPQSLLSVLMPANPPEPRNARIVRLFDLEAAEYDSQPEELPGCVPSNDGAAVEPDRRQRPSREARRAARNESLFAAARLR